MGSVGDSFWEFCWIVNESMIVIKVSFLFFVLFLCIGVVLGWKLGFYFVVSCVL